MDIVTITDANLGFPTIPVRITSIEEDDKGLLDGHGRGVGLRRLDAAYYPSAGAGNYRDQAASRPFRSTRR